jgi:hypothetical protein
VATKLDITWASERDADAAEYDSDRWPPLASICLATASSAVLWVLIIHAILRLV